jgi:hypothetical protein
MSKGRWAAITVALGAAGAALVLGGLYALGSADSTAQDRQPLAFSHELHAGALGVNCLFCHRHAVESRTASIPSMQVCMTCHQSIEPRTAELQKVQAAWTGRQPPAWVRLQRLPDFVYFTHEMHLRTGLQCADCHGQVDRMPYTPRAATYEMGWCLTCHTQRRVSTDCLTCHK